SIIARAFWWCCAVDLRERYATSYDRVRDRRVERAGRTKEAGGSDRTRWGCRLCSTCVSETRRSIRSQHQVQLAQKSDSEIYPRSSSADRRVSAQGVRTAAPF